MPSGVQPRESCIHEAFMAGAARWPNAVAVQYGKRKVTYSELDVLSSQLANYLITRGVTGGSRVAVLMERSAEMIISLLGILKAGGAYVGLSTEDPAPRIGRIIADAQPDYIVTQRRFGEALPNGVLPGDSHARLYLDGDLPAIARCPANAPAVSVAAEDLAYICYTSGSTGRPKGVCVPHRGVNYLAAMDLYDTSDVFLQVAPLAFDASVFELWACLLNGARLVLFPPVPTIPEDIAQIVQDEQVSVLLLATGLFHRTVDGHAPSLRSVRRLIVGGDVLSPGCARRAWHALPDTRIVNGYGVTESTCLSCCYELADEPIAGRPIPIGQPIVGTRVYVLDDDRRLCGPGQQGELYLAGKGLADGYHGQPELTAERFLPDPFVQGERMYRTGDLAAWRDSSVLEFRGRDDTQVKIRGFRVEPGEVETFLEAQPSIRQAVVISQGRHWEGSSAEHSLELQLNAYITTDGTSAVTPRVRAEAHRTLPDYMVPANFIVLDEIPLTRNGKIDRSALPLPPRRRARELMSPYEPPRNVLESILCDLVAEMLGLTEVGIRDSFREIGGDSLTATELRVALAEVTGRAVSPRLLQGSWTVERLAEALAADHDTRPLTGR